MLSYVSCKMSKVRWLNKRSNEDLSNKLTPIWLCGTYSSLQNNVSIWSSIEPNKETGDILQLKDHHQLNVNGDVTQITPINDKRAIVCLSTGDIILVNINNFQLSLAHQWKNIHKETCTDAVWDNLNHKVISCGQDGVVSVIDIEKMRNVIQHNITQHNTLECLDVVSTNEIICGTSSGHLKVFDLRKKESSLTLGNSPSIITCLKRNPNCHYIISYGNDRGLLGLWDLRNNGKHLMEVSTHKSYVSELQYLKNQSNILMSSSFDGQLLKWNISPESQLTSVEAIAITETNSPINSFDVNFHNEYIFSSDNEVLYFKRL